MTEQPVMVITPENNSIISDFVDLWNHRELLMVFTMRDIKLRYKQTGLGVAWFIIQPLLTMIVFSLIFGVFVKLSSDGVPYPLFILTAIIPWTLFAEGLQRSTSSMVTNSGLLTKIYFPRLIMPLASVLSPLVDFALSLILLCIVLIYFHFIPSANIIYLPFLILLAMATAFGVGLWVASLNVRYRDFQYTIPFLMQLWMYASPVVYSVSVIPSSLAVVYYLNPMAGVIEGFRWALLGTAIPSGWATFVSAVVILILIVTGVMYFRRMERYYSDII